MLPLTESFDIFFKYAPVMLFKIVISALCGFVIGFERGKRQKPAGYRTIVLITTGSCLFTIISQQIPQILGFQLTDQTRIAAQIITGIGFLGAGTIIQSQGNVVGLTSAAVIWVMSAVGMLTGFGFPIIAIIITIIVLLFLITSYKIESYLIGKCHYANLEIKFKDTEFLKKTISSILLNNDIELSQYKLVSKGKELILHIRYCDIHFIHHKFLVELYNLAGIKEIISIDEDLSKEKNNKK